MRGGAGQNVFIYTGRAYRRHGRRCSIYRRTGDGSRVVVRFEDGFDGVVKRSDLREWKP